MNQITNSYSGHSLHSEMTNSASQTLSNINTAKSMTENINKNSQKSDSAPVSPAVIINIGKTSILLSSGGNLYQSNVAWNKVL